MTDAINMDYLMLQALAGHRSASLHLSTYYTHMLPTASKRPENTVIAEIGYYYPFHFPLHPLMYKMSYHVWKWVPIKWGTLKRYWLREVLVKRSELDLDRTLQMKGLWHQTKYLVWQIEFLNPLNVTLPFRNIALSWGWMPPFYCRLWNIVKIKKHLKG